MDRSGNVDACEFVRFGHLLFKASCLLSVYSLQDERMTLGDLFEMVVARSESRVQERIDQDHHLDESILGSMKEELDLVGDTCKSSCYLGEMRNS